MSVTQQEHHAELLRTLSKMDEEMTKADAESLSQITDTLTNLENTYLSKLNQLESSVNKSFTDVNLGITSLNTSMEEQITNMNSSFSTRLESMENQIVNQHNNVTNIVNQMDTGIMDYLRESFSNVDTQMQSVFQSVSNGKSLLASALLTRGVTCAPDAAFQEIYNAILAIPQNVTVGVDHLPGEISYEYHYHVDGAGSNPHTETAGSAGGCYSVAMYHSHSGSSSSGGGCYGSPIYHSHSSSCYSEGSHNSSCSWHREYHSYDCGTVHDWDGDGHGCDGFPVYDCGGHRYLSCGRGSGVIGYSLSCGKNNSTVEGYRVGCGLNDGQITGAHIVYSGVNSVSDLALDQTDEVQAVYEEPAVEETISQENVAEDTEQDTEKNIPENTPESVEEDSVDEMDTAASDTEHEESVDVSTEIVKGTEEEICEE